MPRPTPAQEVPPPPHLPEVLRRLREAYLPTLPAPRISPEPLDDLVETILAQQNTAPVTRRQFAALKAAYPVWEAALADGPDGVEATLRGAGGGLARMKADYIWNVLHRLEETRGHLRSTHGDFPDSSGRSEKQQVRDGGGGRTSGVVPDILESEPSRISPSRISLRDLRSLPDAEVRALLESLPGVGMKTASLLMLFDLARPAIPVENHIGRVSARLDLVPARWSLLKIERWFDEVLPREWSVRYAAHVATIRHGRQTCLARRPRCEACVLRDLCPSAGLFLSGEREA